VTKELPSQAGLVQVKVIVELVVVLANRDCTGLGASVTAAGALYTKSRSKPASEEAALLLT
jgi:hypothetical protein